MFTRTCFFSSFFFFFNDTATTEIYTLSLHDALPISSVLRSPECARKVRVGANSPSLWPRSEEHTSELQSLRHLVCRLLLEKKKKLNDYPSDIYARTQCVPLQLSTQLKQDHAIALH